MKGGGGDGDISAFNIAIDSWDPVLKVGTISVTFHPTEIKSYDAHLQFASVGSVGPKDVYLKGTIARKSLNASPFSIAFDNTEINTTSNARTVTVTGAVRLNSRYEIWGLGSDASAFAIIPSSWSPLSGGVLIVKFTPTSKGSYNAALTITSSGATDQIIVETSGQLIGHSIEVYTIYGVLVSSSEITGTSTTINVSAFAKGTYIVRVDDKALKVIKN